jgi:peptidoglycan hydrolase CwlO-like protein
MRAVKQDGTPVWALRVAKVVEPKRQKLREAEAHLEQANKQLQEKQDALAAVVARVDDLKKRLGNAQSEQRQLNEQVTLKPCHD